MGCLEGLEETPGVLLWPVTIHLASSLIRRASLRAYANIYSQACPFLGKADAGHGAMLYSNSSCINCQAGGWGWGGAGACLALAGTLSLSPIR